MAVRKAQRWTEATYDALAPASRQPRWQYQTYISSPAQPRLWHVETLTFLFTDIEGSTNLLRRLGESSYA